MTAASLGDAFAFAASAYTANGGNWLSAPSGGTTTPFTGTYTVRTNGLAGGTYLGEAIFQSATAAQTVPITLIIVSAPAGTITATSGAGQSAQVSTAFPSPLVVTVRDASGNLLSGATVTFAGPSSGASATFASAGNIASVRTNSSGQATSPIPTANTIAGSYSVVASVSGLNSSASFALTNDPPKMVTSIAISAPSTSLMIGSTEQFIAMGTYSDGSIANITGQVTWSSSNPATATISGTGLATAVATGSASITASRTSVTSNSVPLIVTNPPLTSIAISAPSTSLVKGSTEQFTAMGTYSDGSTANITSQVTWSSSNPATATISGTGLANAVAMGSTGVSANFNTITSNSFPLFVTLPTVATAPVVVSYSVLFGSQSYNVIGSTRNRLPWQITGIQVVFSEPITGGTINSLGGVSATSFSGLGTTTLTWNINPLAQGTLATILSGSGANALTDASGNLLANGAGFSQMLKVLFGDFNDDGYVTSADMVGVNNASTGSYDLFADENGDGTVSVADVQTVRSRLGTSLP